MDQNIDPRLMSYQTRAQNFNGAQAIPLRNQNQSYQNGLYPSDNFNNVQGTSNEDYGYYAGAGLAAEYDMGAQGMGDYAPFVAPINTGFQGNYQIPQQMQPVGLIQSSDYSSQYASPISYQGQPFMTPEHGWVVRVKVRSIRPNVNQPQYPSPANEQHQQGPYFGSAPSGMPGAVPMPQKARGAGRMNQNQNQNAYPQDGQFGCSYGNESSRVNTRNQKRSYEPEYEDDIGDIGETQDQVRAPKRKMPTKLTSVPSDPSDIDPAQKLDCKIVKACTCNGHKKVPRPRNAFIQYRQFHAPSFQGRAHGDISKALGEQWRNESAKEKAIWKERADKEKVQHAKDHPNYKYTPRQNKLNQFGNNTCVCGAWEMNMQAAGFWNDIENRPAVELHYESKTQGVNISNDEAAYDGRASVLSNMAPTVGAGRRSNRLVGKSVRYVVPGEDDPLPDPMAFQAPTATMQPQTLTGAPNFNADYQQPIDSNNKRRPAPVNTTQRDVTGRAPATATQSAKRDSIFGDLSTPPAYNTRSRTSVAPDFSISQGGAELDLGSGIATDAQWDAFMDFMNQEQNMTAESDIGSNIIVGNPVPVDHGQAGDGQAIRRSSRVGTAVAPATPLRTSPRLNRRPVG